MPRAENVRPAGEVGPGGTPQSLSTSTPPPQGWGAERRGPWPLRFSGGHVFPNSGDPVRGATVLSGDAAGIISPTYRQPTRGAFLRGASSGYTFGLLTATLSIDSPLRWLFHWSGRVLGVFALWIRGQSTSQPRRRSLAHRRQFWEFGPPGTSGPHYCTSPAPMALSSVGASSERFPPRDVGAVFLASSGAAASFAYRHRFAGLGSPELRRRITSHPRRRWLFLRSGPVLVVCFPGISGPHYSPALAPLDHSPVGTSSGGFRVLGFRCHVSPHTRRRWLSLRSTPVLCVWPPTIPGLHCFPPTAAGSFAHRRQFWEFRAPEYRAAVLVSPFRWFALWG